MTQHHPGLTVRPISGPAEADLFNTLSNPLNDEVAADLEQLRRRPEWLWIALRDERVVARAGWWSRPGDADPLLLDIFDTTSPADGRLLLETALAAVVPEGSSPPDYIRFLPPDWREREDVRRDAEARFALVEQAGAKLFVERLRLEWLPGTPVGEVPARLEFRPPHDADELIGLMALVLDGTLDAYSRDELTRMTPRAAAEYQYREELESYRSPHDWWRIATLPGGEPVGFVIPAHNGYNPIIAYIGVLPAHRGHGHIDGILAAGTAVLAAQDVPRIRASTDVGNAPMAAAFARAGYRVFERQVNFTWS
ncbi:GNAT family N-acetyltransferase [Actinoplanes regularis]|uniref:Protein N-acetyltransferase, RimJ/RimL family n=1 Tax=Actinoplanes regularis TaxID=52697 RepID=A0A238Y5U1_9ACTN|nr:GNAT family N-acetyltransferase [Actinoplanes regularis]GIE86173.1 N-acetyltransferase [Actinoplanes regularis]SNR66342.1 Protein N-acetyltransferase, RimJ/RimL family [Actinoplanes regularis]